MHSYACSCWSAVYGIEGVPASANVPGPRSGSASGIANSGNLWLFGGSGIDSKGSVGDLNDLWSFNPTSKWWTWISGSSTAGAMGIYGELGVSSASNVPGPRNYAVTWTDKGGNLWVFGGWFGSNGTGGYFSDLWRFQP
jgi:N-acetylneuraminic acid mutarotase